jgi:diguanylate cyclase (GGDEF)-like protein
MSNLALRLNDAEIELVEQRRLDALDRLDVLDSPREDGFDGIARLVRNIFRVDIGFVSIIDGHRQWFKASEGMPFSELARCDAICEAVVATGEPLVLENVAAHPRFAVFGSTRLPRVAFYAGVPLVSAGGEVIGTVAAMHGTPRGFDAASLDILVDLARVAMAELEMRRLVPVDAATGLMSRRALTEEGDKSLALARRHEIDVSCIAFEIDGLQAVHDTHGQQACDAAIAAVAHRCRSILRRTDHLGRISGSSFAVVLPHTDRRGALEAAEKLRAAVADLKVPLAEETLRLTASFGAGFEDEDVDDGEDLLARADAALAAAKAAGGNRVTSWQSLSGDAAGIRRRVLRAARITAPGIEATAATVRQLSRRSATVDVCNAAAVPDAFTLKIGREDEVHDCQVISRTARRMEVRFV